MTEQQALAHAQKRWGANMEVERQEKPTPHCIIGYPIPQWQAFQVIGQGRTWEAAFADADAFILRAAKLRRQQSTTTGSEHENV